MADEPKKPFSPFGRDPRGLVLTEEDVKKLGGSHMPSNMDKVMIPVTIDHDSPEQVELRKNQGDPLVMYLIVRESLNMTAGKIGPQCGHAADMVLLKYLYEGGKLPPEDGSEPPKGEGPVAINRYESAEDPETGERIWVPFRPETLEKMARHELYFNWLRSSFRKVALSADEKEWAKVKDSGLKFVTVRDAGLTQVAPGSETVLAIWPMYKSQAPKVIKRLQVLK